VTDTIKIVIPTAGWATRMRPQTWSKPKPLIGVAGRAVLDHILETFAPVSARMPSEYVIIVGPHLGETQIPPYVEKNHPDLKTHFVLQPEMKGQSDALWLAREHLDGPLLMCFSDTLIGTDLSFVGSETLDGVAMVQVVPDPRRFGVAELNTDGIITRLIEKPKSMENNLAVVGFYYFKDGAMLVAAIEEQQRRGAQMKGEYFLTDAVNIMIERGARLRTQAVDVWLDTGTIEATLGTNRWLLAHGRDNSAEAAVRQGVTIIPPVFLHPSAQVENATIGPHASIGADCHLRNCRVADSIVEAGARIEAADLRGSFVGREAVVRGRGPDAGPLTLNIGDTSVVSLD